MSITVNDQTLALSAPAIALAGGTWIAPAAALALSDPAPTREQALLVSVQTLALSGPALAATHYAIPSLWTVTVGGGAAGAGGSPGAGRTGLVPWDGDRPTVAAVVESTRPPFVRD